MQQQLFTFLAAFCFRTLFVIKFIAAHEKIRTMRKEYKMNKNCAYFAINNAAVGRGQRIAAINKLMIVILFFSQEVSNRRTRFFDWSIYTS